MDTPVQNHFECQREEALRHYQEVSAQAHHWSSFVENAIKAYNPQQASVHPLSVPSDCISRSYLRDKLKSRDSEMDRDEYMHPSSKAAVIREVKRFINWIESAPSPQVEPSGVQSEGFILRKIDTNKHYWCKCENCGWEDSSEFTVGCHAIADSGDYTDPLCPICFSNKLEGEPIIEIPDNVGITEVKMPFGLITLPYKKTIAQLNQDLDNFRYPAPAAPPVLQGDEKMYPEQQVRLGISAGLSIGYGHFDIDKKPEAIDRVLNTLKSAAPSKPLHNHIVEANEMIQGEGEIEKWVKNKMDLCIPSSDSTPSKRATYDAYLNVLNYIKSLPSQQGKEVTLNDNNKK